MVEKPSQEACDTWPVTRGIEALELADWRRRIAELYAEVRRLASTDPPAAHARWRATREQLYGEHPQSPVPVEDRAAFQATHFPYKAGLRFELPMHEPEGAPSTRAGSPVRPIQPAVGGDAAALPSSTGAAPAFERIGWVEVPFSDGRRRLSVFWLREYSGGLFLPFADATNGGETYGAGRYLLDGAKGADLGGNPERGTLVLDFNFAYQPSCAFDPRWACPLAPPENRLDLAVHAGETLGVGT